MAIVKMKKLRLVAARSQKEDVLKELLSLGCVEITEPEVDPPSIGFEEMSMPGDTSPGRIKGKLDTLNSALDILNNYDGYKSGFLKPLPDLNLEKMNDARLIQQSLDTAEEIVRLDEKIRTHISDEGQVKNTITSLMPWQSLDVPLEMTGTRSCAIITGTVPKTKKFEMRELEHEVYTAAEATQIYNVSEDEECYYLMAICMKAEQNEVLEALRGFNFAVVSFGAMKGSARENIEVSRKRLEKLEKEKVQLADEIRGHSPDRQNIWIAIDSLSTDMDCAVSSESMLQTEHSVLLEGWLSQPDEEELKTRLGRYDCAWETKDPSPEEYEDVPIKLKNSKFSNPLNMVTEMYSLPAYDGIDPNPLMAPFFILFYGMMIADIGYGLLMLIAGIFVTRKAKPRGMMNLMFSLAIPCGISAIVWGLFTGGFLGDFIPQVIKILSPDTVFTSFYSVDGAFVWFYKPLFTPLNDTIMILFGALALGFVHLMTGTVIGFIRKVKRGKLWDGIFEEGTWWVIFAGIGLAVFGIGNVGSVPVVLAIGIVMLLIGGARGKRGFGIITGPFAAIYNGVTGYFGDILSYSRLMALMLSGSVIAQVFNTIGAIPGNIFVFVLVALVGNALNFALNLLGCFVHDLRLQCLEFFGKFYEDGGRAFRPLEINPKYHNVVK